MPLNYICSNCGKEAPADLPMPDKGTAYITFMRQEPPKGWLIGHTAHACIAACSEPCYTSCAAKAPKGEHDILKQALEAQR